MENIRIENWNINFLVNRDIETRKFIYAIWYDGHIVYIGKFDFAIQLICKLIMDVKVLRKIILKDTETCYKNKDIKKLITPIKKDKEDIKKFTKRLAAIFP